MVMGLDMVCNIFVSFLGYLGTKCAILGVWSAISVYLVCVGNLDIPSVAQI